MRSPTTALVSASSARILSESPLFSDAYRVPTSSLSGHFAVSCAVSVTALIPDVPAQSSAFAFPLALFSRGSRILTLLFFAQIPHAYAPSLCTFPVDVTLARPGVTLVAARNV